MEKTGHVYLFKTREFLYNNKPVFKIGQTIKLSSRMNAYPNNSILILANAVKNPHSVEQFLKNKLKDETTICHQRNDLGFEWFEVNANIPETTFISKVQEIIFPFIFYNIEELHQAEDLHVNIELFSDFSCANKEELVVLETKFEKCGTDSKDIVDEYFVSLTDKYKATRGKKIFYFLEHRWHEDSKNINIRHDFYKIVKHDVDKLNLYEDQKLNFLRGKSGSSVSEEISKAKNMKGVLNSVLSRMNTNTYSDKILEYLMIKLYDETFIDNLDSNPHLLAFNNGVWDFDTNTFRDGRPSDMLSCTVNFDYVDTVDMEAMKEVDDYLHSVFPNDEQRNYVIRMIARDLYGDKTTPYFHIHYGKKAGKTAFYEILKSCLGKNVETIPRVFLTNPSSNITAKEIELWRGVRILICENDSGRIDTNIFQRLNEKTRMTYRPNYQNQTNSYKSMFKFHILSDTHDVFAENTENNNTNQSIARYIKYLNRFVYSNDNETSNLFERDPTYIEGLSRNSAFKMEFVRKLLCAFEKDFDYRAPDIPELTDNPNEATIRSFLNRYIDPAENVCVPMRDIKTAFCGSVFSANGVKIDKNIVERLLGRTCMAMKRINGHQCRNVFVGYRLIPDTPSEDDNATV